MLVLTAAIVVAAITALGLVAARDHETQSDLQPVHSSQSRDEAVRRLVERGQVPAAQLDDGTQITSKPRQPLTRDQIVRQLVARGLVPAATLDDGTQIAGEIARSVRFRDEIVRQLVARGLIPAATLDDGTQVTGPATGS